MASAAPTFPSTKETTNYARLCRLLVDVGTQALRDTFDNIHPPGSLGTVLSSSPVHSELQSLRKKRVLSSQQWDRLYPKEKTPVSSKDFDITLLMVLLRNICDLALPPTGWDRPPPVEDTTPEADIARVKWYKYTLYDHASEASVDDRTFSQYWKEIQDALVRLGGTNYQNTIDDIKNECMNCDFEKYYQERLKQWVQDEVSIKEFHESEDKFDQFGMKLDGLKESMGNSETRTKVKGNNLLIFSKRFEKSLVL